MGGRCAYLTTEDIGNFVDDSDLSIAPMTEPGCEVEMLPWRWDVDWNEYGLVYICKSWDYQNDVEAFLGAPRSHRTLVGATRHFRTDPDSASRFAKALTRAVA